MLKVGDLFAALHLDSASFNSGLKTSEKNAQGWASRIGSTIKTGAKVAILAIGGIATALLGLGVGSIDNAKEVQETERIASAAFGKAAKGVTDWAGKNAYALGVEDDALARSTAAYGRWAQNVGMSSKDAIAQGEELSVRAAQIAAATGKSYDEVFNGLLKGAQGATRGLKDYGVAIDTNVLKQKAQQMGLYSGKGALDLNAASQARYALILEQTNKYVGAAADAHKQLGFQQQQAGVVWDTFMDAVGTTLIPIISIVLTALMPALQGFGNWVNENAAGIQATLTGVFAGISTAISFFTTTILPILVSAFNTLVNEVVPAVATALGNIAATVMPIFSAAFTTFTTDILPILQSAFNTFVTVVLPALSKAFNDIAAIVVPAFNNALTFISTNVLPIIRNAINFIANDVLPRLSAAFNWLTTEVLPPISKAIGDVVAMVLPPLRSALEFLGNTVLPALWGAFEWLEKNVLPPVADAIKNISDVVVPPLRDILQFLTSTVLPALGGAFTWMIDNVFTPVGKAISNVVDFVLPPLRSAFEFFTNTVIPAFQGALDTLGNTIRQVWDGLVGIVKGAINLVIGALNFFIRAINGIQIHIPGIDTPLGTVAKFDWNGLGIPEIPYLAKGIRNFRGGLAVVGERGPELLNLPSGTNVTPGTPFQQTTFHATFNVTRDESPEEFARRSLLALRREVTRQGMTLA